MVGFVIIFLNAHETFTYIFIPLKLLGAAKVSEQ